MVTLVTVIHVIVCLFLILTILLQAGKGGGMGAAFGGAGTQTVFGGRGAATFLSKLTTVMAMLFVLTSILLAYWASQHDDKGLRARSQKKQAATQQQSLPAKGGLGTTPNKKVPAAVKTETKPSPKPEQKAGSTPAAPAPAAPAAPAEKVEPKTVPAAPAAPGAPTPK